MSSIYNNVQLIYLKRNNNNHNIQFRIYKKQEERKLKKLGYIINMFNP